MELVAITRVLLSHRWLLVAGAVFAVLAGLVAAGALSLRPPGPGSAAPATATAVSRVQIDAPRPLVADKQVKGAETITPRTRIFALLMAREQVAAAVARRAGLAPGAVQIVNAGADTPLETTPLADEAASSTVPDGDHVVTVSADPQVPVISLIATGPEPAAAERLAGAARAALVKLVDLTAPGAAGHRYVHAEPLGGPTVEVTRPGFEWHVGAGTAIVVLVLWCTAIVLGAGARRRWREAGGRRPPEPLQL